MRSCFFLFLILSLFFNSHSAFSWGKTGHRVVAEIAEFYLKPNKKKIVHSLLNGESMANVADWMDFIRSNPEFKYLETWHYQNIDGEFKMEKPDGYLIWAIEKCLKDLSSKDKKVQAFHLKILIHLMGDFHMPLHFGKSVDHGGNKLMVEWFGRPVNLHHLWDEELINFQELSYTEYKSLLVARYGSEKNAWTKGDLMLWARDSHAKAKVIYSHLDVKLGYEYNYKFKDLLDVSLYQAGIRLAHLLNDKL